jgi:hypothetical protein
MINEIGNGLHPLDLRAGIRGVVYIGSQITDPIPPRRWIGNPAVPIVMEMERTLTRGAKIVL